MSNVTCPNAIRAIYMREKERHLSENNFTQPIRRRNSPPDTSGFDTIDANQAEEPLRAWYRFHEDAHHKMYQDFYSKIIYCQSVMEHQLSPDTFLELIADRSFLFLEFNENSSNSEYPLLSQLVNAYESTASQYPKEKLDQVLNQAFVPTKNHLSSYYQWKENLEELQAAKQQRKEQIDWFDSLSSRSDLFSPFKVKILESDEAPAEIDSNLDQLFRGYVKACEEYAYVTWHAPRENRDKRYWKQAILCTRKYLESHPSKLPGYSALVFFHLFTQNAEKLLDASLSVYCFKKNLKSSPATTNPNAHQARTHERIRCNILLFDQLLELFLAKDLPISSNMAQSKRKAREKERAQWRSNAKFLFYRYSRYDRYWHFDLHNFWEAGSKPQIDFSYPENYKDGVDFFGNMLRYHINYCIPAQIQWLLPTLSLNRYERPETVLATLLLAEGTLQIPARKRLINRIQNILKSKAGADMIDVYARDFLDEGTVKAHLENWCKVYQLRVPKQEALTYEPGTQYAAIQGAGRQILEYFLRDRMIQRSRQMLTGAAKDLFKDLTYNEFSCDV